MDRKLTFDQLLGWGELDNIAVKLEQEELDKIGAQVVRDFDMDDESRSDWKKTNKEAVKLAKQVIEKKDFPWEGASSVVYPLITTASLQFAARAYPEIIQGNEIVKGKVVGRDLDGEKTKKADRVSIHMSYQLSEEMEEWEEETDKLLTSVGILGLIYRKTYYDSVKKRNVSQLVFPMQIDNNRDYLVVNHGAKSLETARRVSHWFPMYENDVYERVKSSLWLDVELGTPKDDESPNDMDAPHGFIEQHLYYDMDGDGYKEPYIITVHQDTKKVVRIIKRFDSDKVQVNAKNQIIRIEPKQYFTKFPFMPNPDGGFHDMGFGLLLYSLNESINASLRQMLDTGALYNAGGGFISKGIKLKRGGQSGDIEFTLGEWKVVDLPQGKLADGILPNPTKEPSVVMFQLLGLLIKAGEDIGSVKDVLMGEQPGANVPATTVLALIEQGMKVYSAIYKRIYRSLKQEYKKLFMLNYENLSDQDEYFRVLDEEQAISKNDYDYKSCDVVPVADPNASTDIQRLAKARALIEAVELPGIKKFGVTKNYLRALKLDNIDEVLMSDEEFMNSQKEQQQMTIQNLQLQVQKEVEAMKLERDKLSLASKKAVFEIAKMKADTVKAIADAEAKEKGTQIEGYKAIAESLKEEKPSAVVTE